MWDCSINVLFMQSNKKGRKLLLLFLNYITSTAHHSSSPAGFNTHDLYAKHPQCVGCTVYYTAIHFYRDLPAYIYDSSNVLYTFLGVLSPSKHNERSEILKPTCACMWKCWVQLLPLFCPPFLGIGTDGIWLLSLSTGKFFLTGKMQHHGHSVPKVGK